MNDYIKRDDVLTIIDNYGNTVTDDGKVVVQAVRDILSTICPTADVEPVKHGHNDNRNYCGADEFRCSRCGIHLEDWVMYEYDEEFEDEFCYEYEFDYCPNCGARMDGGT